ncbi:MULTISPECIES: glycosyltransferase family 1 protein [unclassified Pseudomonas]|uniref:glycosyltransferase family 4 protein n=1 Tax=unclassified Pseudomonas TaxID=196821 RepID=UPI000CCFE5E1|nr:MULTISPECIES: glycosyltransferase family 1 protein [unclassified Pseudomonas]POA35033.1 glycosyltransferase family 1 protein [Pseudomonas sp. GW456-R21]POA70992.1 glycosyltransferase family 1 protein [Pseudomonas sp. GW460-R15]
MTRLLIECTHVFEHPQVNSGIQRVVRNVINQLPESVEGVECIPVVILNGKLYRVLNLAPLDTPFFNRLLCFGARLEHLSHRFYQRYATLEKRWPMNQSRFARRALYAGYRCCSLACFSVPLKITGLISKRQLPRRCFPLQHQPSDHLVLLDSSWQADFFPMVEKLKCEGVGIISIIYDLIPLTHPQFYEARLVKVFTQWFDWIARTADAYVAISATVRDQLREELLERIGPDKVNTLWFDYFYLGSELDLSVRSATVEPRMERMFAVPDPVFLMVSTIEPRKNHEYLLDAFEQAWAEGSKARLCIIGGIGWKCESLISRVRNHPELNKRLFMFNSLTDTSLEYAYSQATALVFPSYVEGFGLPLVEAMQRGLPVMASDIPVFREIGKEFVAYFDLDDPKNLASLITGFERSGDFPATRNITEWSWICWREASQQMAERVQRNLRKASVSKERQHADCP